MLVLAIAVSCVLLAVLCHYASRRSVVQFNGAAFQLQWSSFCTAMKEGGLKLGVDCLDFVEQALEVCYRDKEAAYAAAVGCCCCCFLHQRE